jgi:hypothetical protein
MLLTLSSVASLACARHQAVPIAFVASCDKRADISECEDYEAEALDAGYGRMGKTLHDSCAFLRGSFVSEACPLGKTVVGSCVLPNEVKRYYSTGPAPFGIDTAQKDCRIAEGRWLAP